MSFIALPPLPTEPPDEEDTGHMSTASLSSSNISLQYEDLESTVGGSTSSMNWTIPTEEPIPEVFFCIRVLYTSIGDTSIRYWDVALLVPNFLFMLFLLLRSRIATSKLRQSNRPILFTFYALVFTVTITSIVRAVVSMIVDGQTHTGDTVDMVLWIVVKFFLIGVEMCVVIFGVGFSHLDSRSSIIITLTITSAIALAYSITQGVLEILFPDPNYSDPYDIYSHGGMIFWAVSSFIFFGCYATVLILPLTRVRYRINLPAKHSFYFYVATLAVLNLCQGVASVVVQVNIVAGSCVTDITTFLYFSFFAPLIYVSFLHNFFKSTKQQLLLSYASGPEDDTDETHHMPTPPFVISKDNDNIRQTPPYQSIYDSTEFLHGSPPPINGQLSFAINRPETERDSLRRTSVEA